MLNSGDYSEYKFVWVFKDTEKFQYLCENRNTTVVKDGTIDYLKAMASSKYWIHNYRVADSIHPDDEQVYVQCWHGTPLKKLGYDIEKIDNAMNSISEIQFKYKIDAKKFKYLLSPSPFATEKFQSVWNLKSIGKEDVIIEQGYPRNDRLINYSEQEIDEIKRKLGITDFNKKIIFYAPTWRDNQHQSGLGYTYKTEIDFDILKQQLGYEYIILFRGHYLVSNQFDIEKYEGFVYNVSDYNDINDLYIVSDMLITDYSSVFFDYANLRKPMLFYMYDFDEYKNNLHDFYVDIKELPGPIIKNRDERALINEIYFLSNKDSFIRAYGEKYIAFHKKFNPLDDGFSAKRVVEKIFNQEL